MTPVVEFERVAFTYPDSDQPVFTDATLTIPAGEFVLVTGRTGSGKSTLLRAVNGLVPHFSGGTISGHVRVCGRNTLAAAPRYLADVAGFVPQDPGAAFVVDRVEDELAYAMENVGVEPGTMRRRVEETMDLLAIEGLRDRSVRTLSGGERQRVAIAAALTLSPQVLVLDEPTSQLDPQGAEDILAALQRLVHDLGLTVIVAEHRLERVAGFVDAAVGCVAGAPPRYGAVADVLDDLRLGPPVTALGRLVGWSPPPLTTREARARVSAATLNPPREQAPAPTRTLLEAGDVSISFGPRRALTGVTVALNDGEIVAVMGRNGAGKTTLLRALCGLTRPDAGAVLFDDAPPRSGVDASLCPQVPESLLFSDSVAREVQATIDAHGGSEHAVDLLRDLGLEDLADHHPRDLSAGQRLLVAVAAIAATGAPVLLLDEPTRGLDPEAKARLIDVVRNHAGAGNAVGFATHDVELAARLATRVVILAGGEVIADGSPRVVLGDSHVFAPQMSRVFGAGWLTPEEVAAALTTSSMATG